MDLKTITTFTNTLFNSWGHDTPPEAVWSADSFLMFLCSLCNTTSTLMIDEESPDSEALELECRRIIQIGIDTGCITSGK